MTDKHFFNVGEEKSGDKIFLEFSVKCTDCDASLVHRMELNKLETARLAADLILRLGVAQELQQAILKVVGKKVTIEGDSKLDLSTH